MYIRKYSRITDYIIITTGIIILTFCWIRFYTHNSTLSIILAILLGISTGYLAYVFNSKRLLKQQLTTTNQKRIQNLDFQLSFASQQFVIDYFSKILTTQSIHHTTNNHYITTTQNEILYPYYLNSIDDTTIRQIISTIPSASTLTIIASNYSKNTTSLCQNIRNINIQLLTTAQFLKKYNITEDFPIPTIIDITKPKITLRQILKGILDRKKSKTYLLLGILLLFYSFFIPYKIYYLVFGSILILFSILSRFLSH